jgi:putative ubiquitin-RnfH superfamily antitoxin RatB of RatAB toxin-antitoxin module
MRVSVVVAFPQAQETTQVDLPEGSTLAEALDAAGIALRHPGLTPGLVGIWGRRRTLATVLREGDRVEIYRTVQADAKGMRRARARFNPLPRSRSEP